MVNERTNERGNERTREQAKKLYRVVGELER